MHLVIVESPAKARTVSRYLGKDYVVESSIGHVRDLPQSAKEIPASLKKEPWSRLGIDITNNFQPLYVIPEKKKSHVQKLKRLLKNADSLYLATDGDREGESISWHLREVLQPKVPVSRLVFHEITSSAIEESLKNPRDIDQRLVRSQETRRVLDRLYGYEISPILWRVIGSARSAGRVQSVAVRLTVMRERERIKFCSAQWCDIQVELEIDGQSFTAVLQSVDGRRLAVSKDFSDADGQPLPPPPQSQSPQSQSPQSQSPQSQELLWLKISDANSLAQQLKQAKWQVSEVQDKPFSSKPPPPFITSTLQQQASGKLYFSPRKTMQIAQNLYEQGHITYMRTDSTTLSQQALKAITSQISALFGNEYLPASPRKYTSKVKNAQEAHEAIRPSGSQFKKPEQLNLSNDEQKLYKLIWQRTLACQMKDSLGTRTQILINAQLNDKKIALFHANGQVIKFQGWLKVMSTTGNDNQQVPNQQVPNQQVPNQQDPNTPAPELTKKSPPSQDKLLPPLKKGDTLQAGNLQPREHATQPPPRYNDASLIKELESRGIGRPSTYASIIDTILYRGYVLKKSSALFPTFTAFALVQLLERHFSSLIDFDFTARMEDILDAISRGDAEYLPYLEGFYHGSERLSGSSKEVMEKKFPVSLVGLKQMLKAEINAREVCSLSLLAGEDLDVVVRVGRWGPFLEDSEGKRVSLPPEMVPDELTIERVNTLLEQQTAGGSLGKDSKSGKTVFLKNGRYGLYVQLGETGEEPKMKSLLPDQVSQDLTLEDALRLLSLPREVGESGTGEMILADYGRYGPYLRCGKETRSLEDHQLIFSCTVAEAEAVLAKPRAVRRVTVLHSLGKDSGGKEVKICSGRYGPYVTDGDINASLPRGQAPEELKLEEALELLRAKSAKGPATKKYGRQVRRGGKTTAKGRY